MKTAERFLLIAASIAAVLSPIIQVLQWLWPNPFSFFSSILKLIQIGTIIGIGVFIIIIWRIAFKPQAKDVWKYVLLTTCLIAIIYTGWIGSRFNNLLATNNQSLELYSQVSKVAWNALNGKKYNLAISVADVCISTYESEATKIQQGLIALSEPLPPVGTTTGITEKKIKSHGVLNEVAACYYIKALAMEELGLINEAKTAYNSAQKYPYARVFDPNQNLYWSPAQNATERLVQLP